MGRVAEEALAKAQAEQAAAIAAGKAPKPAGTSPYIGEWLGDDAPAAGQDLNEMYQNIFGRDVGQEGMDFYQPMLDSGELSMDDLYKTLMASPERQYGMDEQNSWLDEIYERELGRPAFREGEEFYNNMDPAEAARQIRASEEAQRYRDSGQAQETVLGEEGEWPAYTESGWDLSPDDPWGYDNPYTKPADPSRIDELFGGDGLGGNPGTGASVPGWGGPSYAGGQSPEVNFGSGPRSSMGAPGEYERTNPTGDMSNQQLYDTQFQNLLNQSNNFQEQQQIAAGIRNEANAKDPAEFDRAGAFDWFTNSQGGQGLSDIVMGTASPSQATGAAANDYKLNQRYDWGDDTTNQQIIKDLRPTFSAADQTFLNKHPDYIGDSNSWASGGQQAVQDWVANNPYKNDKGWTDALNKLQQSVYTNYGVDALTPGGVNVPAGYASPTNR